MNPPFLRLSVVIATLDRVRSLEVVLRCLRSQTRPPDELIIASAGDSRPIQSMLAAVALPCPVTLLPCAEKSAAGQRNQAAERATGEILAFLDDDIEFGPELFAALLEQFEPDPPGPLPGAISPRLANQDRPVPGRLTRWYYRIQSGYAHRDYGGRLFGAGINCFPVFLPDSPPRMPADWLPSTCLFVRADLFRRHQFPRFTGYSFAEDVHLTARIAREAPLYFLREPAILHHSLTSEFKADRAALTAGKLHNMAVVAREVQELQGWSLWWHWQLHRLFMVAVLLLRRPTGWTDELRGVARART
ncbi:MAG: glycosyltransferase family 2 protein [Opitutales bacterium]